MGFRFAFAAMCVGIFGVTACGNKAAEDEPPACLAEAADATCTNALYGLQSNGQIAPTFSDVFTNTLSSKCGVSGCHAAPNPENGLELDQIDTAYQDLVTDSAADRVRPGDVQCGKVIVRLETAGHPWSMPEDSHLDEGSLCSIRHWIKNGAAR
jgi:hypothetical protein